TFTPFIICGRRFPTTTCQKRTTNSGAKVRLPASSGVDPISAICGAIGARCRFMSASSGQRYARPIVERPIMLTEATIRDRTEVHTPPELLAPGVPVVATEEVPSCPICGHNRFGTHTVGFDYELLTCRNPWRLVRCEDCGHVWLNPRPALSALPTIYPS